MKKNQKNEELQSRREFFKKAAKGVLPIMGAMLLASNPITSKAAQKQMGCRYGCSGSCYGCRGGCSNACRGCGSLCRQGCSSGCAHSAY